jgi:hypothetical protein
VREIKPPKIPSTVSTPRIMPTTMIKIHYPFNITTILKIHNLLTIVQLPGKAYLWSSILGRIINFIQKISSNYPPNKGHKGGGSNDKMQEGLLMNPE